MEITHSEAIKGDFDWFIFLVCVYFSWDIKTPCRVNNFLKYQSAQNPAGPTILNAESKEVTRFWLGWCRSPDSNYLISWFNQDLIHKSSSLHVCGFVGWSLFNNCTRRMWAESFSFTRCFAEKRAFGGFYFILSVLVNCLAGVQWGPNVKLLQFSLEPEKTDESISSPVRWITCPDWLITAWLSVGTFGTVCDPQTADPLWCVWCLFLHR